MKIRGVDTILVLGMAVAMLAAGCSQTEDDGASLVLPDGDFVEVEKRLETVVTGEVKLVETMAPEDVIVAVNGYPLTKRYFEEDMAITTKSLLKRHSGNPYGVREMIEERKRMYVPQFVMKRLLIDDAKRQHLLSDSEVRNAVGDYFKGLGKTSKKSAAKIWSSIKAQERPHVLYDVAERIWVNANVASNIPPLVKVDSAFVAKVQARVAEMNQETRKTNDTIRVKLLKWKADILAGKASFAELANKYSRDVGGPAGKDGYWGEFEQAEMSDRRIARPVFKLAKGEISDPLEDEEGYHLVKVLDIKPPERNAKGRLIQAELRKLAHIYLKKEPELIRQTDEAMFDDLRQQMQMQAIDYYANVLMTNGQNTVVYPHGNVLFR